MRRWLIGGVSALAAVSLAGTPAALAATPDQVYRDYATNGRLDQQYSSADLQRALKSASIQGYGKPTVKVGFKAAVAQVLGAQAKPSRALPFTGLDLALLSIGGASLLAVGGGLRRLARAKK